MELDSVALFLLFAWGEINWSGSGIPVNLSVALTAYSAITWTGMSVRRSCGLASLTVSRRPS